MSREPGDRAERQISRDRKTIRGWADQHEAVPVLATTAQGDSDRFHIISESGIDDTHERMEWDDFFDRIEESEYVVVYRGQGADEPFEITGQSDVISRIDDAEIEERLLEGETVTSTITETTVVESVVVEEATIESELVGRDVIGQRVIDAVLRDRMCMNCDLVEDMEFDARELFAGDRYLATIGGEAASGERMDAPDVESESTAVDTRTESAESDVPMEFPYHAEFDVEETWSITREDVERIVVESRITDTEVTEADTIEDHDIDIEGLHQSIIEQGIIEEDRTADEILASYDIESELSESDRITTNFTRERTVEDEVVERKRLTADITDARIESMETTDTRNADIDVEPPVEVAPDAPGGGPVNLTEDAIGHDVVDAAGEKVGIVSEVKADENLLFVDTHPGIAARIQAALGWGDENRDDYRLGVKAIERITDDEVVLKSHERLTGDERER